eukprot:TRINITY_DN74032_c0_g1_i1.p1 TRINITY_DN74032_c0_g1~~TRINITY_DN74032_c0_g1_i1.p1  ORF type:complete len:812 (+),score=77.60 TRINITY_DN74032_c0_g1_i1:91-2526(+)
MFLGSGSVNRGSSISFSVENGTQTLSHIAGCKKAPLLLVGGHQVLSSLELSRIAGGEQNQNEAESKLQFKFETKRNLGRRTLLNACRCSGVCFKPDSDCIAASSSTAGHLALWDTVSEYASPLIKCWTAHKNSSTVTFLPSDPRSLVSGGADGHLFVWKLEENIRRPLDSNINDDDEIIPAQLPTKTDLTPKIRPKISDLHAQPCGSGSRLLVSYETGSVGICDLVGPFSRGLGIPMNRIFSKSIVSGRWHPYLPDVFAVASQDKTIRIIDSRTSNASNCLLRTGPVRCVRWRIGHPDQLASTPSDEGMAAGSSGMGSGVLVWDVRRPFVPVYQIGGCGDPIKDFLWADRDHVISCGGKGTVQLSSVPDAHQPLSMVSCASASWAIGRGGCDLLAAVVDDPERELPSKVSSEPFGDSGDSMKNICFDEDVGLSGAKLQNLKDELSGTVRKGFCLGNFFSAHESTETPTCSLTTGNLLDRLPERRHLLELDGLSPFDPPEANVSVGQICARQASACLDAGQPDRAQVWRLLSGTVRDDISPERLLTKSLDVGAKPSSLSASSWSLLTVRSGGASLPCVAWSGLSPATVSQSRGNDADASNMRDKFAAVNLQKWQEEWCDATLRQAMCFLEDQNDLGMLLSLVANLGVCDEMGPNARRKLAMWAQSAASIMGRAHAFEQRAAFLRSFPLAEVQVLSRQNTLLQLHCARCMHPFEPPRTVSGQRSAQTRKRWRTFVSVAAGPVTRASLDCSSCRARRTPQCAICGNEVRGLWTGCQVCGHGGHMRCVRSWFCTQTTCPAGCGHKCQSGVCEASA